MRAEEIHKHLRAQPFMPLRLYLSDGSSYDVRHSEMAIVSHRVVAIGIKPGPEEIARELVYCDPVHITRIEPINGSRNGGRKPRRGK